MKKINIVVRDDNFIRMFAPLSFAFDYASKGKQVDFLFINMALLALTPGGAKDLSVDGKHADKEPWLRKQLENLGIPPDVHEFLKTIKQSGEVGIYGCRDSAAVLAIEERDLIEEAKGLINSSKFIEDAVDEGVHCMYF